jgi:glycosyltransferase involved in cell wall biosynthesis
MKIVFIGPFGLQPKSTMRSRALPLARALVQRGHELTVLLPPWDDPARAGQAWRDGQVDIVNIALPPRIPLLFQFTVTHALLRQALLLQPEVIHFFKPKAFAGLTHWAAVQWRRRTGLSVRLLVDTDDWEQAWNEKLNYPIWQQHFFTWQERWGLAHADGVTVASRELERLATAHGARRIVYVPNGVTRETDPAALNPIQVRQRWQLGEAPTILLLTRFVEFRLERVVRLVQLVAEQIPSARWLIVGSGLYGEERQLEALLAEAGLEAYVRFTGWASYADLPAYGQAAQVAAVPFDNTLLNRTKCSAKVLELLKAGIPVVADAVGQNCEYIQTGSTGLLTPPEDDKAFSRALVWLLADSTRQQALGRAAARYVKEHFNWPDLARIMEEAYH